tara:strand:+ start:399 stop:569 length:171 start_codon:yes stop_codon:yes gene_type:complete
MMSINEHRYKCCNLAAANRDELERYKRALEEIKEIAELPPVDGAILRIATETLEDS